MSKFTATILLFISGILLLTFIGGKIVMNNATEAYVITEVNNISKKMWQIQGESENPLPPGNNWGGTQKMLNKATKIKIITPEKSQDIINAMFATDNLRWSPSTYETPPKLMTIQQLRELE